MFVKYSDKKIFWGNGNDNKPSVKLFETFKAGMLESNFKVNFKTLEYVEIVVPKANITYLWVNDDTYNHFYFYNRLIKILDNAYVLEFKLDVYTTYTLPYIDYLVKSRTQVKINRHKRFKYYAMLYKDEMLDAVPIQHRGKIQWNTDNSKVKLWRDIIGPTPTLGWTNIQVDINPDIWGGAEGYFHSIQPDSLFTKHTIYFVFSDIEECTNTLNKYNQVNRIALVPAIGNGNFKITSGDIPAWVSKNAGPFADGTPNTSQIYLNNDYFYIAKQLLTHKSNQFKGVVMGPPVWNFPPDSLNVFCFSPKTPDKPPSEKGKGLTLYVQARQEGIALKHKDKNEYYIGRLPNWIELQPPPVFNRDIKLSVFAANYINLKYNNNLVNVYNLLHVLPDDEEVVDDVMKFGYNGGVWFNYTSQAFITTKAKYTGVGESIYSFVADLPIYVDNYQKYIAATRSSRDTGLSIAAQNMAMGVISSAAGGAISAATGNVAGAVSSGFSAVRNIVGFGQKVQMLGAELKDRRTTLTTEIMAGNIQDAAISAQIINGGTVAVSRHVAKPNADIFDVGDFMECYRLTVDTIKALNNVLYLYGQFNPMINELGYFLKSGVDFNYVLFDAEYLNNIFSATITATPVPLQNELFDDVFKQLTGGVRLWNKEPVW